MSTVATLGLLNIATMMSINNLTGWASFTLTACLVFGGITAQKLQRIQRLDKFEKDLKG